MIKSVLICISALLFFVSAQNLCEEAVFYTEQENNETVCVFQDCIQGVLQDPEIVAIERCTAVGCPEDAKICEDGSTVSRVPPNCEFAECPECKVNDLFYFEEKNDNGVLVCYVKRCDDGFWTEPVESNNCPVDCTDDVFECPNGDFVSRVPPNCEFEECPECDINDLFYFEEKNDNGVLVCYVKRCDDGFWTEPVESNNCPVACTEDAKICPDGTIVERIPPNCEFEECPEEKCEEGDVFYFEEEQENGDSVCYVKRCVDGRWTEPERTEECPVACSKDAKVCPDGTIVERIPPNCEFEECPEEKCEEGDVFYFEQEQENGDSICYMKKCVDGEWTEPERTEECPVACTDDAKICPDGSTVSRFPPNCEFEECPKEKCEEGDVFYYEQEQENGDSVCYVKRCVDGEWTEPERTEECPVACTDDAKICPDGSTVSRFPPNCEFEECPKEECEEGEKYFFYESDENSNERLCYVKYCREGEWTEPEKTELENCEEKEECEEGEKYFFYEEDSDEKLCYVKYCREGEWTEPEKTELENCEEKEECEEGEKYFFYESDENSNERLCYVKYCREGEWTEPEKTELENCENNKECEEDKKWEEENEEGVMVCYFKPCEDGFWGEVTPCDEVACTKEAKVCEDGSTVGRVPPSCEFEECPKEESGELSDEEESFGIKFSLNLIVLSVCLLNYLM